MANPIAKSFVFTLTGLSIFAAATAGEFGKHPRLLPLDLFIVLGSGATLAAGCVESRKWHQMEVARAKQQVIDEELENALLAAQVQGAIHEAKKQYMPDIYNPPPQLPATKQRAIAQLPASPEHTDTLPVEDLARTAAYANRSIVVLAPSGCGKTSFIRRYLHASNDRFRTMVDFTVFDHKGDDEGFCGLEKSPSDYFVFNGHETTPAFYSQLETIASLLKQERQNIPVRWISDEFNNSLLDAKTCDALAGKNSRKFLQLIPASAYKLATQGRSKDVLGIITSHSPQVEDIGLNTSIAQSLWLIALGMPGNFAAIEQILDAKVGIMTDGSTRKELTEQFNAIKKSPALVKRVVALTNVPNLEGHSQWRLILLPDYSADPGEIRRSSMNQSVVEIVDGDRQQVIGQIVEETLSADPRDLLEGLLNQDAKAPHEELYYSPKKGNEERNDRKPYHQLPALVQRLIDKGKELNGDVVQWQKVRHFKGNGEKFSKADCLKIFKQAEKLGWGIVSQDTENPTWYLMPSEYPSDDSGYEDTD